MRSMVVLLALLAVSLTGCSDDGDEGQVVRSEDPLSDGVPGTSPSGAPRATAPQWAVGDAWTFSSTGGPATYTIVVADETGSDWITATDNAQMAFFDALTDVSNLGPQSKSGLEGSQGDNRVQFFSWPLENGKMWSTKWDGFTVNIKATHNAGVWDMVGTVDGQTYVEYTYDPATRWFTRLAFFDNETLNFEANLQQAHRNWTGDIASWTLETILQDEGQGSQPLSVHPFTVAEGVTDIYGNYALTCTGTGGYTVALQGPSPQQGYTDSGQCDLITASGSLVESPAAGQWGLALSFGAQEVDYSYHFMQRTLAVTSFPGA